MAPASIRPLNTTFGVIVLTASLLPACGSRRPTDMGRSVVRLEKALTDRIERAENPATAAVSLVDLESGLRFGVNDEVKLDEAATIRAAVLLEVFRQVDRRLFHLDDLVTVTDRATRFDGTTHTVSPAETDTTVTRLMGGQLPVRELLRFMIVNRSALATNSLVQRITPTALQSSLTQIEAAGTAEGLARGLELIARCKVHSRSSCEAMLRLLADHKPSTHFAAGSPGTRIAHLSGRNGTLQYEAGIFFPEGQKPYVLVIATSGFTQTSDEELMRADLARMVAGLLTERYFTVPLRR